MRRRAGDDRRGVDGTNGRGHEGVEAGDPGNARSVERIAADEPTPTDVGRNDVVAPKDVIELVPGEGFDLVELVASLDHGGLLLDDRQVQVRVLGLRITDTGEPVPAGGTSALLDTGTGDHDVIATLGVEVIVTTLADHHVVTRNVVVVEEQR